MRLGNYSMVLWAKGKRDPVRLIREIHNYMAKHFGKAFTPDTIDGDQKIKLDDEYLERYIWLCTTNDGMFHSFLKAGDELRFNLTLNRPPKLSLPEVLSINYLKTSVLRGEPPFNFDNLLGLFQFAIRLFEPFWGTIWDSDQTTTDELQKLRLRVDGQMIPYAIHWFNYFGPDMIKRMGGGEKLLSAPVFLAEPVPETGGILIVLQQTPFDYTLEAHRKRQQAVQDYLELSKLHQVYLR